MKQFKLAAGAGALSIALGFAAPAGAWGDEGHSVVAHVAYLRLQHDHPEIAQKIDAILGGNVLRTLKPGKDKNGNPISIPCNGSDAGSAATWPDCVKHTPAYQKTANYHFDDIILNDHPMTVPFDHPADWCKAPKKGAPKDQCLSYQLPRYIVQLNSAKTARDQAEALAFILHLVGDMHQPLHDVDNKDVGGNNVTISNPSGELHGYFDSNLVVLATGTRKADVAVPVIADWANQMTPERLKLTDRVAWILDSHDIADDAYGDLGISKPGPQNVRLPNGFADTYKAKVKDQLALAAIRLEAVLIDALATTQVIPSNPHGH